MAIGTSGTTWEALPKASEVQSIDNMDEKNTEVVHLIEGSNPERESLEAQPIVHFVGEQFSRAKIAKRNDELRMLASYRNFRGQYGPDVVFQETEKNRSFIKITKTKALAAYAQIIDILFSGNKFPIGVEHTPVPEGIAETVSIDPAKQQGAGAGPQAQQAGPKQSSMVARPELIELLGPYTEKLAEHADKLEEGANGSPTALIFEPAKLAAKGMEKKMHDQLSESCADRSLRALAHELCVFGTGIYKGPLVKDKEYPKWTKEGKYEPTVKRMPEFSHVSVWDAYPDPDARHSEDMEYFVQRHRMSRTDLRGLKTRPHFRAKSIELAIKDGPNYNREYWEDTLEDYKNTTATERFEVLEYWGMVDLELAERINLKFPKGFKKTDQIQVNVWVCNGFLLRLVLNPYTPARIPFYIVPFELNPYSIFGIGVPENMMDTQLIMNGSFRAMMDNAVLSSNVVFEVDETNLVPGQNMKMHPGKIIRKNGGQPGASVAVLKFPNVTQEWITVFDKARQLADESTGIPSYSHGQGGVQGIGRTAAGMSMLMGAAAQNIKAVIKNIDDYLLLPLGRDLFAFNMQFDFEEDFVGDLAVVARGTESLMRNEVRSQKILQFLELTNNPTDAPWVKRDYLLRDLAETLDLDPDKTVNDSREAGLQALQMQELQKMQGIDPNGAPPGGGAPGNISAAPSAGDPTQNGGGNIGPGAAPEPGSAGNSSNGGTGGSKAPKESAG